ncbi:MAG: PIN domain-containing protein [Candidatus ainarchaeum sp.]|nr:PIN domain-containing protein [Candidatus ainarchaeum sp.]
MAFNGYYVDSCIWLNLFKMEIGSNSIVPSWKIAKDFFEKIIFSEDKIYYSGFVIKELSGKLDADQLQDKIKYIRSEKNFVYIKATEEDYAFARNLEQEFGFKISFFDCMHIAICKRNNFVLVTRDKLLIGLSGQYIPVMKPEELFP